jgi:hypothetical protein
MLIRHTNNALSHRKIFNVAIITFGEGKIMNRFNIFGLRIASPFGEYVHVRHYHAIVKDYEISEIKRISEIEHLREMFKDAEAKFNTLTAFAEQTERQLELARHNAHVWEQAYQACDQSYKDVAHQRDEYKTALAESHTQYDTCKERENDLLSENDALKEINALLRDHVRVYESGSFTEKWQVVNSARVPAMSNGQYYAEDEYASWAKVIRENFRSRFGATFDYQSLFHWAQQS